MFTTTLRKAGVAWLIAPLALGMVSAAEHDRDRGRRDTAAKVAALQDLEGAQASIGRPAMNGFVLALEQQATDDAPRILAALYDTKTDPDATLRAAEEAASTVSVAAGFTDNDPVLLAGPIFRDAGIPFLSVGATDPALPDVVGDNVFLVPFGDNTQAAAGAEFARRAFGDSVAILWDSTSQYSRTLPRYFRARFEELSGRVLLDASYDGGCDVGDLGREVAALSTPPSFVYLAGLPDCVGDVVASLRAAGVDRPILGGDGLDTPNLLHGGQQPTDGVWYTTHAWLSAETGTARAKRFIADYEAAYGAPPQDAFAALGYDAANLLIDVLHRAGKVKSRSILEALEATSGFEGVTGAISYTPQDHVPLKTVWIVRVEAGRPDLADSFVPERVPPPIVDPD